MKKRFSILVLMLSVLCIISSCEKEQTGLHVNEIPGSATITGTLVINGGQAFEKNGFVDLKSPAAGVKVIAKVSNSDLDPLGNAVGYTDFETVTDSNGEFAITIPAVDNGVSVKVVTSDVVGEYSSFKAIEDGEVVFETRSGVYSYESSVFTLTPGKVKVIHASYTFAESGMNVTLSETAELCIVVGKCIPARTYVDAADYKNSSYYYEYNGEIVRAKNVNVVLSVTYQAESDGDYRYRTYKYAGTTNRDGVLYLDIPCTSRQALSSASLSLAIPEFLASEPFTYYDVVYNVIKGKYSEEGCTIPANKYTYYKYTDNMSSNLDFKFFTPVVKALLRVDDIENDPGILKRIDNDSSNDYKYYYDDLYNKYSSYWGISNFIID